MHINEIHAGVFEVDAEGYITEANLPFARMLKRPKKEVVESLFESHLSKPSRILYQSHLLPTLRKAGAIHEILLHLQRSDGEDLPILLSGNVRGRATLPPALFSCMEFRLRSEWEQAVLQARREAEQAQCELTRKSGDLQKAHQDLQAALAEKDRILSMAAHDFRNPIGSMMALAQLIEEELEDHQRAKFQPLFRDLHLSGDYVLKLISNVLDFGKIQDGKLLLLKESTDLWELVRECIDFMAPIARERQVQITLENEGDDFVACLDPLRISQVLHNLLGNAIKFSPSEGRIRVRVEKGRESLMVLVADEGPGVLPGEVASLFGAFERGSIQPLNGLPGSGLGLWICDSICRAHGATIIYRPGTPTGAEFCLSFPL